MNEKVLKIIDEIQNKNSLLVERLKLDYESNDDYFKVFYKFFCNKDFSGNFNLTNLDLDINRNSGNYSYEYIDEINFKTLDENYENKKLTFFKSIVFNSYQDVLNHPRNIYVCDKNFFKNIDKLIINFLVSRGYNLLKTGILEKKITDKFKVIVNTKVSYRNRYGFKQPNDFVPPLISFEIDEINVDLFSVFARDFALYFRVLFPFCKSTLFYKFFIDYNNPELLKIHNEPKLYHNSETNEYILENSEENVYRFNKCIYMYIELYKHYFEIFEEWLIDDAEPLTR